jgi:WD40 repeat protein
VTAPAAIAGVAFEPGLAAQIVSDMTGQPAALPLMQHALAELFEHRSGTIVTAEAYQRLGGVSAALIRRADALYEGLTTGERRAARDVFLRLVAVGEASETTRRRVLLSEIVEAAGADASAILDAFGGHRLLSFDRDPVTRGPTVEIAHEALLSEWGRLRDWIADARADIESQRHLGARAAEWRNHGHSPDFLLGGARFSRYAGWLDHPPVRLTAEEQRFLAASGDAVEAARSAEHRRVRRLRRLVAGITVALGGALIAGGLAVGAQRRAHAEAQRAQAAAREADAQTGIALAAVDQAELASLISRSAAAGEEDPDLALLLALEAHRRAPGSETEHAVLGALGGATIVNRVASRSPLPGDCLGFSVFWGQGQGLGEFDTIDGRIVSRDPLTGTFTDHGPSPGPCAVGFVDAATGAAMAVAPGALRHWVGPGWDLELEFDELVFPIWVTPDRYLTLSFAGETQTITVYDTNEGEPIGEVSGGIFLGMDATADGSLFAISFARPLAPEGDGRLFVVDAASGEERFHYDTPDGAGAVVFDDATGELIAGYLGGTIITIDPATADVIASVDTEAFEFVDLGVTRDGFVVGVARGSIEVVDRRTGSVGTPFEVRDLADGYVRPDGTVVTQADSGEVSVFDLTSNALVRQSFAVDPLGHVAFHDGRASVLNVAAGQAEVIDLASGDRTTAALNDLEPLALHPTEDGLWAMSIDLTAVRLVGDRTVEEIFMGSGPGVTGVRNGRTLMGSRYGDAYAVIGQRPDGTREASLVGLEPGRAGVLLTVDAPGATASHPSLDDGIHVIDELGTLRTYDSSGELIWEVETGTSEAGILALDPTRRRLAVGDFLGGISLVDLDSQEIERLQGDDQVESLGFGLSGRFLAAARRDGTVQLWDVERREPAGLIWDGTGAQPSESPYYDETSGSLWVASSGELLEVPLDAGDWVERACDIVSRELTQQEWDRLVPGDDAPRSACGAG